MAKLTENLTCPLCYEVFNGDSRMPKALPCIHSICFQCLNSYVAKTLQEKHHCPLCQSEFVIPKDGVKGIPTNVSLRNMLELLPHGKHNNEVNPPKPVCRQHGFKECVFVCRECRVGLCNSCITTMKSGPHYPHMEEVSELDAAMDDLKRLAEVGFKKVDNIIQSHKQAHENALAKLLDWKTSIKQDVNERAKKVIHGVVAQRKTLETEIDALYDYNMKEIERLKKNDIKTKTKLEPRLMQIKQMCRKYDFDAYEVEDEIVKTLKGIDRDINAILQSKIPTLSVKGIPFPVNIGCVSDNTFTMFLVAGLGFDNNIRSQTWYFRSLPWKIYTTLDSYKGGTRYLGVYVRVESPTYTCKASFEASLLTYKDGRHHCTAISNWQEFSHLHSMWGWPAFISWNDLTDPANGYVKDNSFTVVATVTVKPPHKV